MGILIEPPHSSIGIAFKNIQVRICGICFAVNKIDHLLTCMDLCAFNDLSNDLQLIEVIDSGIFLLETERYGISAQLFELYGFYFEIYMPPISNKVVVIQAFDNLLKLGPYLEAVDITQL